MFDFDSHRDVLADREDLCESLGRFPRSADFHSGFKHFLIEPIYKVWFTIRNLKFGSKIGSSPVMKRV